MRLDISLFLESMSRKITFLSNLTVISGTVQKHQKSFWIVRRSVFDRTRNVSDKNCRENQNTYFVFNNLPYFENRAIYEVMWKSSVQPGRRQMTIWRMRIACWITKSTHKHTHSLTI